MAETSPPGFLIEQQTALDSGAVRIRVRVDGGRVLSLTVPARLASAEGIAEAARHAVATLPPAVDPRAV